MRVLMYVHDGKSFEENWARAAASDADTVVVNVVQRLDPHAEAISRHCGRIADRRYQLAVPSVRGKRHLGAAYRRFVVVRHLELIESVTRAEGSIDLLHTHFYASAAHLPALRRRLGIPYVITEHSTALTRLSPDKVVTPAGERLAHNAYRHAARVLPVSLSLAEAVLQIAPEANVTVLPNPVDTARFHPAAPLRRERVRLVTVARLEPVKDLGLMIDALGELVQRGDPPVELVIGGSGSQREVLEARVRDAGLSDHVTFLGSLAQQAVAETLRDADLFVSTSHIENLPTAVIEALCCGLPVVSTAVGGVPELIDGTNGALVSSRRPEDIADAIQGVLTSTSLAPNTEIAARAHERFGIDGVGKRLAEVYRAVLNAPARA